MYYCEKCKSDNVAQEETQLWRLNKEDYIKGSGYMNDFFWCLDCDEECDVGEKEE